MSLELGFKDLSEEQQLVIYFVTPALYRLFRLTSQMSDGVASDLHEPLAANDDKNK